MSVYAIMNALRTWSLDPQEAAYAREASVEELSSRYGLTADEATAVAEGRVDWLYEYGVHPMSLIQLSRVFEFSITQRWSELAPNRRSDGP